jgi:dipeptidyl aminopeptidase/acylaminoacyl peptidase
MKKLGRKFVPFVLVVAAALTATAMETSAARPVTVDDLMRLRSISDVKISPDGSRVAYVVSQPSFEKDEHETVLYVVSTTGGEPVRLTHSTRIFNRPRPNPRLRWSPDGSRLSFVAFVNEQPQVVALDMKGGGDLKTLTTAPQGVGEYEWSPDGSRLSYIAPDPPLADDERKRKDKTFVIEVDRQDRPARVWVQDLKGGLAQAVSDPRHFVANFDWSPDGNSIAYGAALTAAFSAQFHTRIYEVPSGGGTARTIVDRDSMNVQPRYSPDGRTIAFVSSGERPDMVSIWGLYTVPVQGGDPKKIQGLGADAWVADFTWAPDSRSLVLIASDSPAQRGARMFEQPLQRLWLDGKREDLIAGPRVNYQPSFSRDGKKIAFRSNDPRSMGDVYVLDLPGSTPRKVTTVNPELQGLGLADQKAIHWKSFDGMEVWGLLITPKSRVPGAKLPLVVYSHGGPNGSISYGIFPQFMHTISQVDPYPVEAMASAGMAILMPMPRGGQGYGLTGLHGIDNSWGEGDYKDIMAGVDHLIKEGIVDPDRLGAMGASYGGYMTDWIVTQTNRFKAASTMASISDLADLYYGSDAGDIMKPYFGFPWDAREAYTQHSPLTFAARVTTPLLIQHGENDRRVPITQASRFYKTLKEMGKTVEMEIYPRGGHVIYEPDLQREIMRRNLEWFRRWLRP